MKDYYYDNSAGEMLEKVRKDTHHVILPTVGERTEKAVQEYYPQMKMESQND